MQRQLELLLLFLISKTIELNRRRTMTETVVGLFFFQNFAQHEISSRKTKTMFTKISIVTVILCIQLHVKLSFSLIPCSCCSLFTDQRHAVIASSSQIQLYNVGGDDNEHGNDDVPPVSLNFKTFQRRREKLELQIKQRQ